MYDIDTSHVADILKDCALKFILPRFRNLQQGDIKTKSHANDFVTIADLETEEALTRILPDKYPGCIVIGEEGVSSGAITTAALADPTQTIFVVDPVDGTSNFKNGNSTFAVMMALVRNGETQTGWIYDVMNDVHYIAEKGKGATRSGEPIYVRPAKSLSAPDCVGYIGPKYFPKSMQESLINRGAKQFRALHCAGHEYINIASGKADFTLFHHMKPWDHLAGSLLVQEAGGIVRKFDGTPYRVTDVKGGLIVASHVQTADEAQGKFLSPA